MKTPGSFQSGHKISEKLKTDELKKEAYKSYCNHIAQGFPQDSWYFEKDKILLTSESMENYFKRYPELCVEGGIFDPLKKKIARCKNYNVWFGHSSDSATGKNEKASTASLQMIMRNIHGWDKTQRNESIVPNETNIESISEKQDKDYEILQLKRRIDELEREAASKHPGVQQEVEHMGGCSSFGEDSCKFVETDSTS